MKKKILTLLLAGALCFSMTTAVFASETETTAESEAGVKLLGEDAEGAFHVQLKNDTGKEIKEVKINVAKKVEYKDAENLLKEDDVFAADEERLLCFLPLKEEEEEETESAAKEKKEPEIPVYNIRFTFADDTTAELHTFPFGDIEKGELHLEGELVYLVFESVSLKQSVNTLESETKIAGEIKAAAEAAAAAKTQSSSNSDYSYEEYYDYSDDYSYDDAYDDYDYGDTGSADDGGGDACLDDGVLY